MKGLKGPSKKDSPAQTFLKASKQTRLKLRNGYHKAPITYKVLMCTQMNKDDQKEIAKGLALAVTPEKAKALLPVPGKRTNWSLRMVTMTGNYGVQALMYKGLEVAAFWKRQTSEVQPDPSDPVPEGVLENPDDVWARLDLFHKSARQLVGAVAEDLKSLKLENATKDIQIQALERINQANDKTIATLQGQLTALQGKKKK